MSSDFSAPAMPAAPARAPDIIVGDHNQLDYPALTQSPVTTHTYTDASFHSTNQLRSPLRQISPPSRPAEVTRLWKKGATQTEWKELVKADPFESTIVLFGRAQPNPFWKYYKNDEEDRNLRHSWWPDAPPPRGEIIDEMHRRALERGDPESARTSRQKTDPSQRQPPVGIGFTTMVTTIRAQRGEPGFEHEAAHRQLFSWNSCHLQRRGRQEMVDDALASTFSRECMLEAQAFFAWTQFSVAIGENSVSSLDHAIMIYAGRIGFKIMKKTYSDAVPFCDWIPCLDEMEQGDESEPSEHSAGKGEGITGMSPAHAEKRRRWQLFPNPAARYLTCYIATYDRDADNLEPSVHRANQDIWHVSTIHINVDYSDNRHDVMITIADYIGLCLRDQVDIISGNWNLATEYLTECVWHVVDVYEHEKHMPPGAVKWTITDQNSEYRTIIFNNWSGRHMWTKEQMHFNPLFAEDTQLRSPEDVIYSPQSFFMT